MDPLRFAAIHLGMVSAFSSGKANIESASADVGHTSERIRQRRRKSHVKQTDVLVSREALRLGLGIAIVLARVGSPSCVYWPIWGWVLDISAEQGSRAPSRLCHSSYYVAHCNMLVKG